MLQNLKNFLIAYLIGLGIFGIFAFIIIKLFL